MKYCTKCGEENYLSKDGYCLVCDGIVEEEWDEEDYEADKADMVREHNAVCDEDDKI